MKRKAELNLQNIPIKTKVGQQLRMAFVPAATVLLKVDYSAVEKRLLEHEIRKAMKG